MLTSCANYQLAALDATHALIRPNSAVDRAALRPGLQYLRLTTSGKAVLLVLGYTDRDASGQLVRVWYSEHGEVFRFRGGRLMSSVGVPVEWRNVALPADLPGWRSIDRPIKYVRTRDEMPGHRLSLKEEIVLQPIHPPGDTELKGISPSELAWFEERVEGEHDIRARYALANGGASTTQETEPIYGEQCLSATFCVSWQAWPPARDVAQR